MSKIAIFGYPSSVTPPSEGFPWDDLRKILPGYQQMAKVRNGVETSPKISIAWVGCINVTDRQATDDRQTTDGRTMTYSEHELEFRFAKNRNYVIFRLDQTDNITWRMYFNGVPWWLISLIITSANKVVIGLPSFVCLSFCSSAASSVSNFT